MPGGHAVRRPRCGRSCEPRYVDAAEAEIGVVVAVQVVEHGGEGALVEAGVDVGGAGQQLGLAEPGREFVHVEEVASRGPVEQRDQLAAGEFFGGEGWSGQAGHRWPLGG